MAVSIFLCTAHVSNLLLLRGTRAGIPLSEVIVLLLDVSVCVLEAECLNVMGDVGDASVEFLRS